MIAPHAFSSQATANQVHLRLLETTDLHVHVMPYDYYSDRACDNVGLARTATLIAAARAEAQNALLFDNGDFLQGNPMGDYIAFSRGLADGDVHPVIAAMNALGFDASTLGNHEFNYGLDFLLKALAGADFPVVSANVVIRPGTIPRRDRTLVPPYVILDREVIDGVGVSHPLRVGLIGFVPPQITSWDRRHLEGRVMTRDILEAARSWLPRMREEGCDLIVALAHCGIGSTRHSDGMENAAVPLARLPEIDALMTGHSHLVFPAPEFAGAADVDAGRGTIAGKPAVMAGFWGSHLGVVDLLLQRDGPDWRVLASESAARPISHRPENQAPVACVASTPAVVDGVRAMHEATLGYVRRSVGRTEVPLHSYFAMVAPSPAVQIVAAAQRAYIAEMLRSSDFAALPVLSAAAPFRAGGRGGPGFYTDVAVGALAIRNVADLYFFPNTICAVKVTGGQLRNWLERAAGAFNRIVAGAPDQVLQDPEFASYNFDVIEGVSYQIDLAQPAKYGPRGDLLNPGAARIAQLRHAGRPVAAGDQFIVATNNFRANGGGEFPGAAAENVVFTGPDTNRDILVRHFVGQGTADLPAAPNWSFVPMPGTSVLFETGPGARDHPAALSALRAEDLGDAPSGFVRFRLRL